VSEREMEREREEEGTTKPESRYLGLCNIVWKQ
jgi:hypothetical protein